MSRYGKKVKMPGLQTVMTSLLPNRTDCEVCLRDKADVTELVKYIKKFNEENKDKHLTVFHCFIMAMARMIKERPYMNRFIQGHQIYQREEISLSFVAKRRFKEGAEEALIVLTADDDTDLMKISDTINGDVAKTRESEHSTGGVDKTLDIFASMPRLLRMFLVKIVKILDFWGVNPKALTDGDPNYSTVLFSNLGSIKGPAVYHHLNNYGTNSIMVTIGTLHKEEKIMDDGHKEIRDILEYAVTLDERIGDGYYFVRSLKMVECLLKNPELLDKRLCENIDFREVLE